MIALVKKLLARRKPAPGRARADAGASEPPPLHPPAVAPALPAVKAERREPDLAAYLHAIRGATARLGAGEGARLAGIVSVQVLFHPKLRNAGPALSGAFDAQHRHAVATSLAAGFIAMRKRGARSDLAALGGLLCDVGA